MDHYSSRDRGTESVVGAGPFSQALPIDCNEVDFDENSTSITPRTRQITDMTGALISFQGAVLSSAMERPGMNWKQRLDVAEGFRTRLDAEVVPFCEPSTPRHQRIVQTATMVCHGMLLRAVRPLHFDPSDSPPSVSNPWVMQLAVYLLRFATSLHPSVEKGWRRIPWIPWHPIAVALAGLCIIRDTDLSEEAWRVIDEALVMCESDVADTKNGMLWRPIKKVYAKAAAYRAAGRKPGIDDVPKDASGGDVVEQGVQSQQVAPGSGSGSGTDPTGYNTAATSSITDDISALPSDFFDLAPVDNNWLDWEAIMEDMDEFMANDAP